MRWLKHTVAVLLLALWLPATNHCDLEHLSFFQFLSCAQDGDSEAPHQGDDCQDACSVVEAGLYKLEENPGAPTSHAMLPAPPPFPANLELEPRQTAALLPAAVPLHTLQIWQFLERAARPPRPPPLIS